MDKQKLVFKSTVDRNNKDLSYERLEEKVCTIFDLIK